MSIKNTIIISTLAFASHLCVAQVANNSVTSASITNGTITASDIKKETIKGAQIKNSTLTGLDIKNSSLTGLDIKNSSLTGDNLANGAITGEKLADGAVDGTHLSEGLATVLIGAVGDIKLTFPDAIATTAAFVACQDNEEAIAASCGCNNASNDGVNRNWGVMLDCRPFDGGAVAYCSFDSLLYKNYLPMPFAFVEATCLSVTDIAGRRIETVNGLPANSLSYDDKELGAESETPDRIGKLEEKRLQILQQEKQRLEHILAR